MPFITTLKDDLLQYLPDISPDNLYMAYKRPDGWIVIQNILDADHKNALRKEDCQQYFLKPKQITKEELYDWLVHSFSYVKRTHPAFVRRIALDYMNGKLPIKTQLSELKKHIIELSTLEYGEILISYREEV